jgi:uncharacterized protein (DUF2267 family)
MTYQAFIEEVCWRTGVESTEAADRAVRATLQAVGERLVASDAQALQEALPAPLAGFVASARRHGEGDLTQLYAEVEAQEPVRAGAAVEHAKVVCEVLTETLDGDMRTRLRARLPDDWAALFTVRERASAPAGGAGQPLGHGHTLADGRQGSDHPLSEAGGPLDRSGRP